MNKLVLILLAAVLITSCMQKEKDVANMEQTGRFITERTAAKTIESLVTKFGNKEKSRIEKGVNQIAALWDKASGDAKVFESFCLENFIQDEAQLDKLFTRMSENYEVISGYFNKVSIELKRPLHLDNVEQQPIDNIFGAYEPTSHLMEDFFANKIAYICGLNFPAYTLKEKSELGKNWNRKQWAYARLGDVFATRIPADLLQKYAEVTTNADSYISEYNIFMGNLLNNDGRNLFPKDMKLISHWGLRDELKSNYSDKTSGFEKQKMIYEVMKHIINQDIPKQVINNDKYQWNPITNLVTSNGNKVNTEAEGAKRYEHMINIFNAVKNIDPFTPNTPTYIQRKFDGEMEISQEDVEALFTKYVSSPQVKKVADIIKKRLGRNLEPFDIWYDGFKTRSSISADELDKATKTKYPTRDAVQKDLPLILAKLDFPKEKIDYISSKIVVDPSRGAGHAWGAQMKGDVAHLRTRIGQDGMNYKGYNIAVHEFGHNVEQTISLYDVDYYMMQGVPNTAFTEALAFIFQKRDLELLGIKETNPDKEYLQTLDNFWATYEIMGVSLVDMNVWKWMYANPNATPEQLKEQVIKTAVEIWNKYYADVFGVKDQPILAIYSHMIDAPLYLSAYPIGHLIDFQVEKYIKEKSFGKEVLRMYAQGRLVPQAWMKQAVGQELSVDPILEATEEAIVKIGSK